MPNLPITTAYRDRYMQQGQPDAPAGQPPMGPPDGYGQGQPAMPAWAGGPQARTALPPGLANQTNWQNGYGNVPGMQARPRITPMPPGFVPPQGANVRRMPGPLPTNDGTARMPGPLPTNDGTARMPGPLPTNDGTARMPAMNDQLAGQAAINPYLQRIMALRGTIG